MTQTLNTNASPESRPVNRFSRAAARPLDPTVATIRELPQEIADSPTEYYRTLVKKRIGGGSDAEDRDVRDGDVGGTVGRASQGGQEGSTSTLHCSQTCTSFVRSSISFVENSGFKGLA